MPGGLPGAASAAGFSAGLRSTLSLESARARRRQEEEQKRADELQGLRTEAARLDLASARFNQAHAEEDRQRQMELQDVQTETGRFNLERARTTADRADVAYQQQQADLARRGKAEGIVQMIHGLEAGADPQYVLQQYNQIGQDRIDSLDYDPGTKQVTIRAQNGQRFQGTTDQLKAIFGAPEQPEQQDLIATDKPIYNPNTGKWELPPDTGQGPTGKDRYQQVGDFIFDTVNGEWLSPPGGGGDNRRPTSPYNPQTVQDDLDQGIKSAMGGPMDAYGRYSFAEGARELGTYRIGLAQDMAGRLEDELKNTSVTPGAIVGAVMDATRDIPTEDDLVTQAEEWRTAPRFNNRTDEQAAAWLENKRREAHAEAEAKLARAEADLRSRTQPSAYRTPDWATGDEIPRTEVAGPDGNPMQLQPGMEGNLYETNDQGQRTGRVRRVRVAGDGRVFEVKGQEQPQRRGRVTMEMIGPEGANNSSGMIEQGNPPAAPPPAAPPVTPEETATEMGQASNTAPPGRPLRYARETGIVSPEEREAIGRGATEVATAAGQIARAPGRLTMEAFRAGTAAARRAPEALGRRISPAARRVGPQAARVLNAFRGDQAPQRSDVRALFDLTPGDLESLGFTPDMIERLNAYRTAESSLAEARTRPVTPQPY